MPKWTCNINSQLVVFIGIMNVSRLTVGGRVECQGDTEVRRSQASPGRVRSVSGGIALSC